MALDLEKRSKRRMAVERWKAREYDLKQKRELSARPEYRAKMRAKYHEQQAELREAGILPRKLGRPRMYEGEEAIEMKQQRAREARARYKQRQKLSHVKEKYEYQSETHATSSECENSD